ncbi:MAG: LysR family transcriptional regulator [Pseudomonas marincola]
MSNHSQKLSYLPWLRTFEAAARRANFTEAAKELGLSQAAVSQQIKLLEHELGEKLFERKQRGVTITAAGAAFLPHVQSAFGTLSRSTGELFGSTAHQTLTIQSPASFASLWLAPRLSNLSEALPNLNLDVRTVHLPADYSQDPANLQIHFGNGQFSGRKAHRLSQEYLVPVVSAAAYGKYSSATIWEQLPLLSVVGGREMWTQWFEKAGAQIPTGQIHRFDTFMVALAAAEAGAGILLGSRPLIDPHLLRKTLIPISNVQYASESGHFITYEDELQLSYAEHSFLGWLKTQSLGVKTS